MFTANNRTGHIFRSMLLAVLLSLLATCAFAQQAQRPDLAKIFDKREVMIPVRDGVKLHTEIYTPKNRKSRCRCCWTARPMEFPRLTRG